MEERWLILHLPSLSIYEYIDNQDTNFQLLVGATHSFHSLFGTNCSASSSVYGIRSISVIDPILRDFKMIGSKQHCRILASYMLMPEYLINNNICSH